MLIHVVPNAISLQLISAYSSQSSGFAQTLAEVGLSESAYPPAYLHQPTGPGGTTAPRGGGAGRPSRYQDDAPLRASGPQSFAGWNSGVEQRNVSHPAGLALSTEPLVTPVSQDFAGVA